MSQSIFDLLHKKATSPFIGEVAELVRVRFGIYANGIESRSLQIAELICRNAVITGIGGEPSDSAQGGQSAIRIDLEDAHGTGAGIDGVEKLAIGTDGEVEVRASSRKRGQDSAVHWSQGSCGTDPESGERAGSGIGGVKQFSIWGDDVPAGRVRQRGDARADHGESAAGAHCVRRYSRSILCARGSRFRGDSCAVWSEHNTEEAGAGAGIHYDWAQRTVNVDRERVDVICEFFRDQKRLAIGTEGHG